MLKCVATNELVLALLSAGVGDAPPVCVPAALPVAERERVELDRLAVRLRAHRRARRPGTVALCSMATFE